MQASRDKDWLSPARPLYVQRLEQSLDPAPSPPTNPSKSGINPGAKKPTRAKRGPEAPVHRPRAARPLRPAPTVPSAARPRGAWPGDSRRLGRNAPRRGAAPGWKGTKPAHLRRPAAPGARPAPSPGPGERPAGPPWSSTRSPGAFGPPRRPGRADPGPPAAAGFSCRGPPAPIATASRSP